jgi:hypothetical protein
MIENKIATSTEPAKLEREVKEMAAVALAWRVTDQPSFTHAGQMLQGIRLYTKKVHDVFDPIVDAAHKAHKVAVDQRRNMLAPVEGAERVLRERMGTYEQEQQRLAREAELARQREQERLEAEARAEAERLEAEQRKAAEDAALAVALQAEEQGDHETAEQIVAQRVFIPPVMPTPVFAPPVSVVAPTAQGVSFRDQWEFEIFDEKAIPREYLIADRQKIGAVVRALKGQTNIPGVRVTKRRSAAVRS